MADNYKSVADVTVRADQFDLTSNPTKIPTSCVADADWSRLAGIGEGYKVKTDRGFVFPKSTDWVIVKGSHTFVIDNTTFALIFTTV